MVTCRTPEQIVSLIVDICRKLVGHAHSNEVALLLGTIAVESGFTFRKQHAGGPARGICQMEPATGLDIFRNYLSSKRERFTRLMNTCYGFYTIPFFIPTEDEISIHLERYDDFAIAMARLHYLRFPSAIPVSVEGQAGYWKQYYNTELGAGTVEKYMEAWEFYRCGQLMESRVVEGSIFEV